MNLCGREGGRGLLGGRRGWGLEGSLGKEEEGRGKGRERIDGNQGGGRTPHFCGDFEPREWGFEYTVIGSWTKQGMSIKPIPTPLLSGGWGKFSF